MSLLPEDRYQTALDLAADIEHWTADEPVSVYREPIPARLSRWVRRHRTLAMVLAGSLAILSLVAIVSAVGLGSYARNESVLRQSAEEARGQSLQAAAILAAETVGREIDRRWEFLERVTGDQELLELFTQLEDSSEEKQKEARRQLQSWLAVQGSKLNKSCTTTRCSSSASPVNNLHANRSKMDARSERIFRGAIIFTALVAITARTNQLRPIRFISRTTRAVYQSSSDKDLKVAFSVPILSGKQGDPNRNVIGILGMSVVVNQFGGVLETKLPGRQTAILVDMRYDYLSKNPRCGLVLHHPDMKKQTKQPDALPHLQSELMKQLFTVGAAKLWESQQTARGHELPKANESGSGDSSSEPPLGVNGLFVNYADPLHPTGELRPIAAYSSVVIPGRAMNESEGGGKEAILDTGWIVIVQEKQ